MTTTFTDEGATSRRTVGWSAFSPLADVTSPLFLSSTGKTRQVALPCHGKLANEIFNSLLFNELLAIRTRIWSPDLFFPAERVSSPLIVHAVSMRMGVS